jgi:hypothetical protein
MLFAPESSQDPGFQKLASAAHGESSPYFTPTRDTDLEQAEVDPQYLAFYSDQLLEIFIDQSALIRAAGCGLPPKEIQHIASWVTLQKPYLGEKSS